MKRVPLKPLIFLCCALSLGAHGGEHEAGYSALRQGDFSTAAEVFKKGAQVGSVEAQYQLAKLLLAGRGIARDDVRAVQLLEVAAASGYVDAQYTLGVTLIDRGESKPGQKWLEDAAENGHRRATLVLAAREENTEAENNSVVAAQSQPEQWHRAAINCHLDVMKEQIRSGIDADRIDEHGRSALFYVTACGSEEGVQLLLNAGAQAQQVDRYSETALTMAVNQGEVSIARHLLRHGADPAHSNQLGDSLLHMAVTHGFHDVLQLLLEAGAPPNPLNGAAYTPTDLAALCQDDHSRKILAANGGSSGEAWRLGAVGSREAVGAFWESSQGSSENEVWNLLRQAALHNEPELIGLVLDEKGRELLRHEDDRHNTLLMYAVEGASAEVIELLADRGMQTNQPNAEGTTALMLAAKRDDTESAKLLLQNRASPALKNNGGMDAIHLALEAGHDATALVLLRAGSSLNGTNSEGETYLMLALKMNAGMSKDFILAGEFEPDLADDLQRTALWYAAGQCDIGAIERLLELKGAVDRVDSDGSGALHLAASCGCLGGTQKLVGAGASIERQTSEGNTPLMLAIRQGHSETGLWLLHSGASVKSRNEQGNSALIFAVRENSAALVSQLLEEGADPYERNKLGESAFTIAESHSPKILKLLKAGGGFGFFSLK